MIDLSTSRESAREIIRGQAEAPTPHPDRQENAVNSGWMFLSPGFSGVAISKEAALSIRIRPTYQLPAGIFSACSMTIVSSRTSFVFTSFSPSCCSSAL